MKKKLFSLTLSVIAAFSAFNSIYGTAVNADDDFSVFDFDASKFDKAKFYAEMGDVYLKKLDFINEK